MESKHRRRSEGCPSNYQFAPITTSLSLVHLCSPPLHTYQNPWHDIHFSQRNLQPIILLRPYICVSSTLLLSTLGSPTTTLPRMLLIPFAIGGLTMTSPIISSVRQLVLDRAKTKVLRRFLAKKRAKWGEVTKSRHSTQLAERRQASESLTTSQSNPMWPEFRHWLIKLKKEERHLMHDISKHIEHADGAYYGPALHRMEFELMRSLPNDISHLGYSSLLP